MNNVPQGNQPIFIMKEGTERIRGKPAQSNNIAAAKAVAESVRSTLGPEGADKMLVDPSGDVVITNDGATILNRLDVEHPAAKLIIEVSEIRNRKHMMARHQQPSSRAHCWRRQRTCWMIAYTRQSYAEDTDRRMIW